MTSIATAVCLSPETSWHAGTVTSSAPVASQTKKLLGSVCFRRRRRRFFTATPPSLEVRKFCSTLTTISIWYRRTARRMDSVSRWLGCASRSHEDGRLAEAAKPYWPAETASKTEGSSCCSARVLDHHIFTTCRTSRTCASSRR